MNTVLSETSPVRLGFAGAVAALAIGAVVSFTRLQATVDRHHDDIDALKKAGDESRGLSTQHEIRLRRLEDNYATIMQSLGKIEAGMERLEQRNQR